MAFNLLSSHNIGLKFITIFPAMNLLVVISLLVIGTITIVLAQTDCRLSLKQFAECAKSEVEERRMAEIAEAEGILNDNITKCFLFEGCSAPAFNASLTLNLSPNEAGNWSALTDWWDELESDKRHCVIKNLRGSFRERFHDCIVQSLPGFRLGSSRDDIKLSKEGKAQLKMVAEHKFRVERALEICTEPQRSKVVECIRKERINSVLNKACTNRKLCAAPLTLQCQRVWNDTYKTPICNCHKETVQTLRKPVRLGPAKRVVDSDIEEFCNVKLPKLDIKMIRSNSALVLGVRSYVAAHEDRMVSICHECGDTL